MFINFLMNYYLYTNFGKILKKYIYKFWKNLKKIIYLMTLYYFSIFGYYIESLSHKTYISYENL